MRVGAIISLHWYFALGALGVFFPFYSLYLRENAGLSGTEVGLVMAAMPAAAIIAQPLWGRIADRTGARTTILTLVSVGAAVGYTTLGFVSGFDALLVGSAMTSMFASAVIPITVSVSFALLGNNAAARFGRGARRARRDLRRARVRGGAALAEVVAWYERRSRGGRDDEQCHGACVGE